jgi:hypothetical protein
MVFVNTLWITGMAVFLAGFSYHYWQANVQSVPLRRQFQQVAFLRTSWFGLLLVGLGLAGTSQNWWETALWLFFVSHMLYQLFSSRRKAA